MFNANENSQPKLIIILCITLVTWLILLPIVNLIHIPLGTNPTGVISEASLTNTNPITDYLKYLVLFLTPALFATILVNLKRSTVDRLIELILNIITNKIVWTIVSIVLISAWLINKYMFGPGFFNIIGLLSDTFHEGEYLAFLPSFLQLDKPFLNTFFIHGFGLNALPSILASKIATHNNGIIITRSFISALNIAAFIGVFAVMWEITGYFDLKKSKWFIFCLLCLFVCFGDNTLLFSFAGTRETAFMWQLALLLRYLRKPEKRQLEKLVLSLFIGVSIPISFFYVYDRAAYFLAIYLFTSILLLFCGKKIAKDWLVGTVSGLVSTLVILGLFLGVDQLGAIGSQVLYWMKYGRYISFIALPPLALNIDSFAFIWPMILHGVLGIYLILQFLPERNLPNFIKSKLVLLILCFASLNYMRITLDRSDQPHALSGASMSFILLVYLALIGYQKFWEPAFSKLFDRPVYRIFYTLLAIGIIIGNPLFDVKLAIGSLKKAAFDVPDLLMIQPEYKAAITQIKPEIDQQSCFYTVPSEGTWYYLLNKPSCSKFSYTFYAKPTIAQNQVIADLESTKPRIILLSNDKLYEIDGVALVYRYFLAKYQPYLTINKHWFWQRRNQDITFVKDGSTIGGFTVAPLDVDQSGYLKINKGANLAITGWSIFPQAVRAADQIYVSYGDDNQLIAVSNVNLPAPEAMLPNNNPAQNPNFSMSGWSVIVGSKVLPEGQSKLKLWSYDSKGDRMVQLGEEIPIKIGKWEQDEDQKS